MIFNKFETTEKIFDSSETILYRAKNIETSERVILKFAKTDIALLRLKNEFEILKDLKIVGVSNITDIFLYSETPFLVISDIEGIPLSNCISKIKNYPIERISSVLINLTKVLARIHENNIIHKDIKPSNILYREEDDTLTIIDFGISAQFDFKVKERKNISSLEGTLNYISPEQTGRVNRTVDQRSDLYSLGITFYELLSGEIPFKSKDSVELIYFHISRKPERLNRVNNTINEITMKLLSKNPESRYQSTYGLLYDLSRIQKGELDFPIATKDFSSRLQINENLFGRQKEKAHIESLLEKTKSEDNANILVIKGDAGLGKSILIDEIIKGVSLKNGYLLKGKHDQIQQNIPYSSITQILKKYTDSIISERIEFQNKIKDAILNELGDNAGILIALSPEIEWILGKQEKPELLEGIESQNRFLNILISLLKVMANHSSPLVIVFDDLQWGDFATFNLLKKIVNEHSIPGLFLILCYRNQESENTDLFLNFKNYLDSVVYVEQLELSNLSLIDILDFLKGTLGENANQINSLAEFIFGITQGNPFFMKELLKEFYSNKALFFDFKSERWDFNKNVFQDISLGDNLLDFIKNKVNSLSENTIRFLKTASCEGLLFNQEAISYICEFDELQVKDILKNASVAGLIFPIDSNSKNEKNYSFIHDKILQSVFDLNSDNDIKSINYKLGNFYSTNDLESKLFDICNFYHKSIDLFKTEEDLLKLVRLNQKAMKLSRVNIAYDSGLIYAKITLEYLTKIKNVPEDLKFSIKEELGWFLYVSGNFEEAEKIYIGLLENCPNLQDYTRLNNVRIGNLASQARIFDSVNLGLEVIQKLGIEIPESEEQRGSLFMEEYGKILSYLEDHEASDLLKLPRMNNEIQILIQQILSRLLIPAILSAQLTLLGILTCKSITLVIEHGSIDLVAYAYALFAVTIIGIKKDYKTGIEFGEIAITASQWNNNKALIGGVFNTVGCITNHLKYPAMANEDLFLKGSKYCKDSGNVFEASLNLGNLLWNKFYRGENLEEIFIHCNNYQSECKKNSVWDAMINIYYPTMGIVNYLIERQTEGDLLHYDNRSEIEHVEIVENLGSKSPLAQFYGILITKSFLFGKYAEILKTGELLEKNTAAPTVFHDICPNFYRCIAYILLLNSLSDKEQIFYSEKIHKLKSEFKIFSELNKSNFLHMYLLILAVENSQLNKPWEATKYFDESIASAIENGYIQNAAIAYELAGDYFKKEKREKFAETYYFESYKLFKQWGAKLKVKSLESKYPWLLDYKNSIFKLDTQPTLTKSKTSMDIQINYLSTIKAADLILREISTDTLIQKIVQVILENSGANEAVFIIKREEKYFVHSAGKITDKIITHYINQPLEHYENISHNVLNYVIKSKKNVILNNAFEQPEYLNNQYIVNKKVQSLLCQPIFHKGDVLGVIYLENNFTSQVFNKEKSEIINLIATLAGISLENATLYEGLDEKVKERTKELNNANIKLIETNSLLEKTLLDLKTTQDQLVISEKMVVLGVLISGIAHEINTPLGAIVASNLVVMDLVSDNILEILEVYSNFTKKEKEIWSILYKHAITKENFLDTSEMRKINRDIKKIFEKNEVKISDYSIDNLSMLGLDNEKLDASLPYFHLEKIEEVIENVQNIFTILNSSKIITIAADKASRVIKALNNYAHQDQTEIRKTVDIQNQIEMCLILFQSKIKLHMEIITDFKEKENIVGFSDQLNQVWINLITNALHAVRYRGRLKIQTFIDGGYLCVSFEDNGPGIPKDIQSKIFNPFFTTKPAGEGSGLGLDICKKIIEAHNGKIEFTSRSGETRFTVFLDRFLKPDFE